MEACLGATGKTPSITSVRNLTKSDVHQKPKQKNVVEHTVEILGQPGIAPGHCLYMQTSSA